MERKQVRYPALMYWLIERRLIRRNDTYALHVVRNCPIKMPLYASTGPVLGRCCQPRTSTGPVLATNDMFTGCQSIRG